MQHVTKVCTACLGKINLQRKKTFFSENITCDPSIYTMGHPYLTVSNIIGNSVGPKGAYPMSLAQFTLPQPIPQNPVVSDLGCT